MLYVYSVQICTFVVPFQKVAIFLTEYVPRLVYIVYRIIHFQTEWNTFKGIENRKKIQ